MAGEAQIVSTDGTSGLQTSWAQAQPQEAGPAVLLLGRLCSWIDRLPLFAEKKEKSGLGTPTLLEGTGYIPPCLCSPIAPPLFRLGSRNGTLPTLAWVQSGDQDLEVLALVREWTLYQVPTWTSIDCFHFLFSRRPSKHPPRRWCVLGFPGVNGQSPPPRSSRQLDHPRGPLLGQIVALNEGIAPSLAFHSPVSTSSSSCGYGVLPPRPLPSCYSVRQTGQAISRALVPRPNLFFSPLLPFSLPAQRGPSSPLDCDGLLTPCD